MAIDPAPFLAYEFRETTIWALWFLLGSFTVSGLSDLKRMSAQREFLEVWALAAIVLLLVDVTRAYVDADQRPVLAVKWGLVVVVALLSWQRTGVVFRLASGDVWAVIAVCALLNPLFVVVFFAVLWVSNLLLKPALLAFGHRHAYPFIPVVLASTLVTVGLIVLNVGEKVESLVLARI